MRKQYARAGQGVITGHPSGGTLTIRGKRTREAQAGGGGRGEVRGAGAGRRAELTS